MMEGKDGLPLLVFVLDDADSAGYFYHDLVQMLDDQKVLFFPSSYKRAIKYNQKDAGNEILRTEVLSRMAQNERLLVVTYPDALAEKVVSQKKLEANTIVINKGGMYDVNDLEKRMLALGFVRKDYVYEPGQFAVRGSIVDVYSFSSENPYRIDFFGDEVDSIRTFDVQTQLSVEKVDSMTVVSQMGSGESDYVAMLEFLPRETVVVSRDFAYVCDRVAQIYDEGFSLSAINVESAEAGGKGEVLDKDKVMVEGQAFVRSMSWFRKVELRPTILDDETSGKSNAVVRFSMSPQPLFHKNFELLQSELLRLQTEGYRINIFADSEKQIARLQDIFSEMARGEHEQVVFEPVGKAIHEGFIDNINKRCYFTDHQIFDRFHKYNLKSDKAHKGKVALTLKEIQQFEPGDYVVHIDHGVGRFGGLVRVNENGVMQEKIRINYSDG